MIFHNEKNTFLLFLFVEFINLIYTNCMRKVLLVDFNDNILGEETKENAHKEPKLHRAFSVFLYNGNKLLVQKRAKHKYHSGGLIANTCCSHQSLGLKTVECAKQRLIEELNIKVERLDEIFTFTYFTKFAEDLYEYELDHVLIGEFDGDYNINPEEVEDLYWIDFKTLKQDMLCNPKKYSSWFLIACPKVIEYLEKKRK